MPYPEEMVAPMRAELTRLGVKELRTAADVDAFAKSQKGTALLDRELGLRLRRRRRPPGRRPRAPARQPARPGRDGLRAATTSRRRRRARALMRDVPAEQPDLALLKDGKLVHFVPRHQIEGRDGRGVAHDLDEGVRQALSRAPQKAPA